MRKKQMTANIKPIAGFDNAAPHASVSPADAAVQVKNLLGAMSLAKIPKTGELIARELRKKIVRGELHEGAFLPSEAELMAQFSVSRASLREALRILETENLLEIKRGSRGGPVVHRPDPNLAARYFGLVLQSMGASLEDVFIARMMMEPAAIRMITENANGQVPPLLMQILEEGRAAVKAKDGRAFMYATSRFHRAIVELSGNKTLILVMHMLNIIWEQHMKAIDEAGPAWDRIQMSKTGLENQKKLLELIEKGNADQAITHWRQHLDHMMGLMFAEKYVTGLIDVV